MDIPRGCSWKKVVWKTSGWFFVPWKKLIKIRRKQSRNEAFCKAVWGDSCVFYYSIWEDRFAKCFEMLLLFFSFLCIFGSQLYAVNSNRKPTFVGTQTSRRNVPFAFRIVSCAFLQSMVDNRRSEKASNAASSASLVAWMFQLQHLASLFGPWTRPLRSTMYSGTN